MISFRHAMPVPRALSVCVGRADNLAVVMSVGGELGVIIFEVIKSYPLCFISEYVEIEIGVIEGTPVIVSGIDMGIVAMLIDSNSVRVNSLDKCCMLKASPAARSSSELYYVTRMCLFD